MNRGLFSPDIKFFKNGKIVHCNVITCAAPNKTAATRYQQISDLENKTVLEKRIKFVLDIAKENIENRNVWGTHLLSTTGANSPSSNTPVQVVVPTKLVINIKSFGDED